MLVLDLGVSCQVAAVVRIETELPSRALGRDNATFWGFREQAVREDGTESSASAKPDDRRASCEDEAIVRSADLSIGGPFKSETIPATYL